MALLLFLYSPPPYYDKTYYYSLLQMIAAIFFDTLRVNVGKRSIFSLYFFVKIPPQEKKIYDDDPWIHHKKNNKITWSETILIFAKKKKMKLKCQNEKIYQSNDDVTHYLSNEKTKHTTPAAVPKITSNFVPDCISSTGKEERRKNPWKRKKKRLFLMHKKSHTFVLHRLDNGCKYLCVLQYTCLFSLIAVPPTLCASSNN